MKSFKDIVEKLKDVLSKELGNISIKDKDVAIALDINYDIFRKNKQYDKIPYFPIMQFLAKRNLVDNIYSNAIKAEELTLEDEWMKEDEWEAVYQQEEKNNGKV